MSRLHWQQKKVNSPSTIGFRYVLELHVKRTVQSFTGHEFDKDAR